MPQNPLLATPTGSPGPAAVMVKRRLVVNATVLIGSVRSKAICPAPPPLATTDQCTGVCSLSRKMRF
jgi:hypothetical protein